MPIVDATPIIQLRAHRSNEAASGFYLSSSSPVFEALTCDKWAPTLEAAEELAVSIAQTHGIAVLVTTVASKVVPWFPECQVPEVAQ